MKKPRYWLVAALDRGCGLMDRLPFGIGVRSHLGCPRGMAMWSYVLDDRWKTGYWGDPADNHQEGQ